MDGPRRTGRCRRRRPSASTPPLTPGGTACTRSHCTPARAGPSSSRGGSCADAPLPASSERSGRPPHHLGPRARRRAFGPPRSSSAASNAAD
eukprot:scaffold3028_cov94-Isochrysis_galbana.AAC.4